MDKLSERMMKDMNRNYFENLKVEVNEVVKMDELKLNIPEGFNKELNSMEKRLLIDDQLLQHGLCLDSISIDGCSRIVSAGKKRQPIEKQIISKRLKEYLEKFNKDGE